MLRRGNSRKFFFELCESERKEVGQGGEVGWKMNKPRRPAGAYPYITALRTNPI
jgi:hypothetical protein